MDVTHIIAGEDDDGRRLDRVLRHFLDEASLAQLYKSIRKGFIKLNGKKCEAGSRISAGDDIALASFLYAPGAAATTDDKTAAIQAVGASPLAENCILFRNEHLLILNKPYDIPVQPSSQKDKERALSTAVKRDYAFYHTAPASLSFRTGPLHRLDRKTTGALCFSQSLAGSHWFSREMQNHGIGKYYIALVVGEMKNDETWNDAISKDAGQTNAFKTVTVGSPGATKQASTHALPLAAGSYQQQPVTLVQYCIHTGRTHQIRAQSAAHGFPLLGDTAYGSKPLISCGQDFFLHAYELHFSEPQYGIPAVIRAPIMTFFQKMLDKTLIKWNGRLIL